MTRPTLAGTRLRGNGDSARETTWAGAVTLPEVVVGGAVVAVAVFSWMALLLMDNHVGRLGFVCLAAAGCLAAVLAVVLLGARRPRIRLDPWGCVVVVAVGLLAGFFFFPGFHYAATDKDPGAYVEIGTAFARHASYSFPDTLAQHVKGIVEFSPHARFPAVWIQPGNVVVPQFYHLWPALLAMAFDVGGFGLLFQVAPFTALLAVLAFVLLIRRAVPGRASLPAAAIGGVLLTTNMLEVWQAKYPSTEAFAQMIFVAILLAVLIAVTSGWAPAAGLAGLLVGICWLERPDGIVIAAIAVGVGAVLLALRRWSPGCWWFAGGLAVVLPHVLWQVYAAERAYSLDNGIPRLSKVAVGTVVLLALGAAIGFARPVARWVDDRLTDRRWQLRVGLVICFVVLVAMVVGFLRRRLFGETYLSAGGAPTYNEQNMRRLAWFISYPGWALAGLGVAAISLRRWRLALWVILVPALLITPIYVDKSRIASRLMWWGRRYVPEVLPGLIALIAVALAVFLLMRRRHALLLAGPAILLAGYLVWHSVGMSARLRHHDEMGGSLQVAAAIRSTAQSARGIYLFVRDPCCTTPVWLFGGATWLEEDQYAAVMPPDPAQATAYIERIHAAMPANPIFLVLGGTQPPPGLAALHPTEVLHVAREISIWEESDIAWPEHARSIGVNLTVWRVGAA